MFGERPLAVLPPPAKIILTLFLTMIGAGYLFALGNLYHRHSAADGREGLSLDDLRVVFHGATLPPDESPAAASAAPRSRMWEMTEPGGKMRKHLSNGGPQAIKTLETWLRKGATRDAWTRDDLVEPGGVSPEDVIVAQCLDCHNADTGEKNDAPFGPDLFTVEYEMTNVFAAPGTARESAPADNPNEPRKAGPQSASHLFLVTHIHMLSIPVFTLIVSGLFLLTGPPTAWRNAIAPVPMIALVLDFSSWWLARWEDAFLYIILFAGPLFAVALAIQLFVVAGAMWRPTHSRP